MALFPLVIHYSMTDSYITPQEFADNVTSRLAEAKKKWKHLDYEEFLDSAALQQVVGIANESSLLTDEGRSTCCSMLLVSSPNGPAFQEGWVRFATPVDFTPENIARLSQLCANRMTALVIEQYGVGKLAICGLATIGNRSCNSKQWSEHVQIKITVFAPSEIEVAWGTNHVYRWRGGIQHRFVALEYAHYRIDHLRGDTERWKPPISEKATRIAFLRHLCSDVGLRISHGRHGGCILFSNCDDVSQLTDVQFALDGQSSLLPSTILANHMPPCQEYDEFVNLLVEMSHADGAIVFDEREHRLLGFGAMVKSLGSDELIMKAVPPNTRPRDFNNIQESTVAGVGSRHRSAISFCKDSPSSMALIVSEDGGVKLVASIAGIVAVCDGIQCGPLTHDQFDVDESWHIEGFRENPEIANG